MSRGNWNLPGSPVVKTSPSNAGGAGLFPGWGTKVPNAVRWLSSKESAANSGDPGDTG